MGGPFLGVLLGIATSCATHRQDEWGDSARAVGHVALEAHAQAKEMNQKHLLVEKGQRVARQALRQAQTWNGAYELTDKVKDLVHTSWMVTRDFAQKHKLVERSVHGLGQIMVWTVWQLQNNLDESSLHKAPSPQSTPPFKNHRKDMDYQD